MAFRTGNAGSPDSIPVLGPDAVVVTDAGGNIIADPLVDRIELETLDGIDTSQTIENRLDSLETDVGTLQTDVGTLQTDVGTLQTDVGTLQTDVGTLQTDVGTLQTDVGTLQTDVGTLQTDVGTLQTDVTNLQNDKLDISTMTTNGDLITRIAGVPARLGIGASNQVLGVVSSLPAWVNPTSYTETENEISTPVSIGGPSVDTWNRLPTLALSITQTADYRLWLTGATDITSSSATTGNQICVQFQLSTSTTSGVGLFGKLYSVWSWCLDGSNWLKPSFFADMGLNSLNNGDTVYVQVRWRTYSGSPTISVIGLLDEAYPAFNPRIVADLVG